MHGNRVFAILDEQDCLLGREAALESNRREDCAGSASSWKTNDLNVGETLTFHQNLDFLFILHNLSFSGSEPANVIRQKYEADFSVNDLCVRSSTKLPTV
jgi:hypothetical protein